MLCSTESEGPSVDFIHPINPIDPDQIFGVAKGPLKFYNSAEVRNQSIGGQNYIFDICIMENAHNKLIYCY